MTLTEDNMAKGAKLFAENKNGQPIILGEQMYGYFLLAGYSKEELTKKRIYLSTPLPKDIPKRPDMFIIDDIIA